MILLAVAGLEGAYDLHSHAAPCLFERVRNNIEVAQMCRHAGYRTVMLEAHHESAASTAYCAHKNAPDVKCLAASSWTVSSEEST